MDLYFYFIFQICPPFKLTPGKWHLGMISDNKMN